MEKKDCLKAESKPILSPFMKGIRVEMKSIQLPKDLVEQVHVLLHQKDIPCEVMAQMISTIFFEARRRDKDSLIRELNIIINTFFKASNPKDLTLIDFNTLFNLLKTLIDKLKQN